MSPFLSVGIHTLILFDQYYSVNTRRKDSIRKDSIMNNLKKIVAIVSVLGLGSVLSAPAYAGSVQAYASGSSAIVLMNGASQSVGAEIALPSGAAFEGATGGGDLLVTPALAGTLDTNTTIFDNLTVNAGAAKASPDGSSFTASAAQALDDAVVNGTLSDVVSIIRAGAGTDGLE
jgi:hypothetical protein